MCYSYLNDCPDSIYIFSRTGINLSKMLFYCLHFCKWQHLYSAINQSAIHSPNHTLARRWAWAIMQDAGMSITSSLGFRVLPKDTSTWWQKELGISWWPALPPVVCMLMYIYVVHISRTLFLVFLISPLLQEGRLNIVLLNSTWYYCWCPAVSPEVASSILSSSCSTSSSILSSPSASSLSSSSSDLLSPSLAAGVQISRPRCLWLRRTLQARPFLLCPREERVAVVAGLRDEDKVEHEAAGDTDSGQWAGEELIGVDRGLLAVDVMAAEGCVRELDEGQGVWEGWMFTASSGSGYGA